MLIPKCLAARFLYFQPIHLAQGSTLLHGARDTSAKANAEVAHIMSYILVDIGATFWLMLDARSPWL